MKGLQTPFAAAQFEQLLSAIEKVKIPLNVDRQTRDGRRPRLRGLILVMGWLGLAIAYAVSLKRRKPVYYDETDHWSVDIELQKTGNPVYVPIPLEVYEELVRFPPEA